jgi:hypothetical protein
MPRRSTIRWTAVSLAVLNGVSVSSVEAGDYLTVPELASKAEGAVVVHVRLGSAKERPSVELVRVLRGQSDGVAPDATWLGLCLPSRELLKKWRHQHPRWAARPLWTQALQRGSYEATLFMRTWNGAYVRFCETEAMDMKHTDVHPRYGDYSKALEGELDKLRANRAPDTALLPVLQQLCFRGSCKGADGLGGSVDVMRDRKGNAALLIYTGIGCPHKQVTYHDVRGTFLVAEQTGPREPDEWNSPDDQKIQRLRAGLVEAEGHACSRLSPPGKAKP